MALAGRRRTVAAAVAASLFLSGCWDRREINDVAFVVATAIDKAGPRYRVMVQIPLPGQMGTLGQSGGGGTSGTKTFYVDSAVGDTIREANSELQLAMSRRMSFAHMRVLLIGEDLARVGISPVIDVNARIPQNRLTAFMLVVKGQGGSVLNADAPMERYPAEMIRELAGTQTMKNPRRIRDVLHALISDGLDPVLPAISVVKTEPEGEHDAVSTIRVAGYAVFRGDRLAGYLEGGAAEGLLWAMNQAKNPVITVKPPKGEGKITIQFPQTDASLRVRMRQGQPVYSLRIRATGAVIENESNYDLAAGENMEVIERTAKRVIEQEVYQALAALQHRFHADPIGYGDALHRQQYAVWRKLRTHWDEVYTKVHTVVDAEVQVENTGNVREPMGIPRKELTE
ncbi:putative spore germination protein YfkR [Alicyclobacillus cellulosilyticus]|uniref:Spore germination protein YfkR n=1 Tax=Alicyclobacillus cellulosilyticus TaxID=1003997 RepID=A0A917K3K5_9BACL|nr:Ger(x)C family spore germination protein [Alicyclobacillus cellulosilyticus]GGI99733.1 putative spore germination protein YfkR [Alicyclobacillus cellulosilyticus]